jgi:hypothetical protein
MTQDQFQELTNLIHSLHAAQSDGLNFAVIIQHNTNPSINCVAASSDNHEDVKELLIFGYHAVGNHQAQKEAELETESIKAEKQS